MRIVNEGALYSDRSKLSVAYYLRARCIRGNTVSHIAFASVLLGENPSEEVDDYNNYYYEFIARNDDFWRVPEIDLRYETKARKVMVDFKFDALYSEVFIKSILKSG